MCWFLLKKWCVSNARVFLQPSTEPFEAKILHQTLSLLKKKRQYMSWNKKPCCQISTLNRLNEQKLWAKKLPQGLIYHTILYSFWCLKNIYPICDSPLWRSARRSAPLQLNHAVMTILVCEQKPYPTCKWFSCRHESSVSGTVWT